MNKEYLPFYNNLNQKEKDFWLNCSKEELIDHFIANVKNGELLLQRIDKAIDYIKENCIDDEFYINLSNKEKCIIKVLEILGGNYVSSEDKDKI